MKTLDAACGYAEAAASGSLSLSSIHVEGTFAKMSGGATGSIAGGGSAAQPAAGLTPQAAPSQAPIKVSSFSISGVDVTDLELGPFGSGEMTTGRSFTSSETNARVALVTKAYAKQNAVAVGDVKKIGGTSFEIVGIVTLPGGSTSSDLYIPLTRAQKLSDNTGKVNQVYVRADSAESIAAVKNKIKATLPKATVTTAQDLAAQVSGSLSTASGLADDLGRWLAIAALIAAFAVACLLTVSSVSRRVREFGTLKALGWKSRRIVAQVMGESVVTGLAGGVIGVALGIAGARTITALSPDLQATMGSSMQLPPGATPEAGGIMEALAGVNRADRARHIPAELSGGEQQRVAIARALVREPKVMLADEPTGNLDERTRDNIIGLLEELWRERGQTLIAVTHDTWVAGRASRRIWLDGVESRSRRWTSGRAS